ncbi:hypothetical protein ACJIZ3_008282 [Penstemon smallii]|uniref:non-specific serine/threonine protein kinase n=1 Tax=Penstemon smallii TaxID=265156 RepID=A0ABD3TA88_9LAMI
MYRDILDRFHSLEASHAKLKEQFRDFLQEKTAIRSGNSSNFQEKMTSFPGWGYIPGGYFAVGPHRNVLENMGHAVHVSTAGSGEIIFWNRAAEKLFGYIDCEVLRLKVIELLFIEEHHTTVMRIMESLSTEESWSGQLPLKKRSGQIFMALVTISPLYENGELVGMVTLSHDASVFNSTNSGNARIRAKVPGMNFKKIQWHKQTQIAALPQIASSVSDLASKIRSWKRGDVRESEEVEVESQDVKGDRPPRAPTAKPTFGFSTGKSKTDAMSSEKEEPTYEIAQPSKIVAKVLSKLQGGATSHQEKPMDENIEENDRENKSVRSTSRNCNLDEGNHVEYAPIATPSALERGHPNMRLNPSVAAFSGEDEGCFKASRSTYQFPRSNFQSNEGEFVSIIQNMKQGDTEGASHRQSNGESFVSGPGSSPHRAENSSNMVTHRPIHWEDLQLREEVGHGSFAVVYRGVWNSSEVAVKVYSGNQCNEQTLLDYKKEIDMMRRLRHPNVLLFMGAVCSEEKLAMVTEYLPRGSLFRVLHKNNQSLDIRRRIRMAIDVARGMNYLHHRNPPIVHRDLKSSNLLVDKSWNVKVGDFGLSKWKNATFLTAKSGRGTPQWMAPEVLRNELSTEKSDVFSFGVILWELMTESIPWNDLNPLQVAGVVGFMNRRLELPKNMDPQISSIISDCWQSNANDRPSFEDVIQRMNDLVQVCTGMIGKTASAPTP